MKLRIIIIFGYVLIATLSRKPHIKTHLHIFFMLD